VNSILHSIQTNLRHLIYTI